MRAFKRVGKARQWLAFWLRFYWLAAEMDLLVLDLVKTIEPGLALADQLRLNAAGTVPRHRNLDLPVLRRVQPRYFQRD